MKIGILTFPKAINYGASLQATALRKTLLNRLDATVDFIPYENPAIQSTSKIFDFSEIFDLKYTLAHLYNLPEAVKRMNNFKKFWNAHLSFGSDKVTDYDIVVTGSDQVWNYTLTNNDWFYFWDFKKENTKKVAYAASFGLSKVDDELKGKMAELFADFDYLSVRERTASNIIDALINTAPPVVLDPTLLLDKEEWKNYSDQNYTKSGYIFVYTIHYSDKVWEYAQKLSEMTGLPIKTISYSKLHKQNADYDFTAGPDRWLSYMMNADYVVTNSFHGLAFSINFEKNFFFDLPSEKLGVGSRLSDITERYALTDRNISGEKFIPTTDAPDFTTKRALLSEDRKFSMDFIDSFLNNK